MTFALINASTLVTDAELEAMVGPLNAYATLIGCAWGVSSGVFFGGRGTPGFTPNAITVQDDADQPGDLGYHVGQDREPGAKIFARIIQQVHEPLVKVIAHELAEAMVDPLCARMDAEMRHVIEVCDPVEEDQFEIDGMAMPNFVYPEYFSLPNSSDFPVTQLDHLKLLKAPCPSLRPGGYIMEWNGEAWVNHFAYRLDGTPSWHSQNSSRLKFRLWKGAPAPGQKDAA